jgi:hypothetical protein
LASRAAMSWSTEMTWPWPGNDAHGYEVVE